MNESYSKLYSSVENGDLETLDVLLRDPVLVDSFLKYCNSNEVMDDLYATAIRRGNLFIVQRLLDTFGRQKVKFPESLALQTVKSHILTDEEKETLIRSLAKGGPLNLYTPRKMRVLSKWYPSGSKDVYPEKWTEEAINQALFTQKAGIVDALHRDGKVPLPSGQGHLANTGDPYWKQKAYITNFKETPEYGEIMKIVLPALLWMSLAVILRRF